MAALEHRRFWLVWNHPKVLFFSFFSGKPSHDVLYHIYLISCFLFQWERFFFLINWLFRMTEDHVGLKLVLLALSIQSFLWECLVTNRLELEMRPHASDKSAGQHFLLPIPLWFLFTASPLRDNVTLIYL